MEFLKKELVIERDRLLEKIFTRPLSGFSLKSGSIKKIEKVKTLEGIHDALTESFKPYKKKLVRDPRSRRPRTIASNPDSPHLSI